MPESGNEVCFALRGDGKCRMMDNIMRMGRLKYLCGYCGRDITLELCLLQESEQRKEDDDSTV
jgi:hypothetical protein